MSTDPEHDDLAQDLHAMRAEPRPEFARDLDRRAAGWLRERPRRRLPSLRIALPAVASAAAAVVVIAIVVSGGEDGGGAGGAGGGADQLEVAVVSDGAPQSGLAAPQAAPENFGAPAPDDSAVDRSGGAFLLLESEPGKVTVQYIFGAEATAKVELAGREADVRVAPGSGSLEISTEGLPSGTQELVISTPDSPTFRGQVAIR